jgi:hypothetical protein
MLVLKVNRIVTDETKKSRFSVLKSRVSEFSKNKIKAAATKVCPIGGEKHGPEETYCTEHKTKLQSRGYGYFKHFANIALSIIPVVIIVSLFSQSLFEQQIPIYVIILLVFGTLLLYFSIRKHGLIFGVATMVIVLIIYLLAITIISGNLQPVYAVVDPFVPPAYRDPYKVFIRNGVATIKCVASADVQKCYASVSSGGSNTPKVNKPIESYKYIDVKFGIKTGDPNTEYKIIKPATADHVFVTQISIFNYADHDMSDITVSGYLLNESGSRTTMKPERCLLSTEHCQVGPGKPTLEVTLRSSKPVDFQANTLVYFVAEVSYPITSQGSNEFEIVKSYSDLGALGDLSKNLAPGLGPLDTVVYFSTPYYVVGSSADNPDAANITVFSDILNGKEKNYGETGYGKIASIKVTHMSDVQIPSSAITCITPDLDSFNENELHEVPGLKVTTISGYTCNFIVPNVDIPTTSKGVKFFTSINYNYTDVKKTSMTVCPSDTSKPCNQ